MNIRKPVPKTLYIESAASIYNKYFCKTEFKKLFYIKKTFVQLQAFFFTANKSLNIN